jgi:hypothetical protein
VAEMSDEMTEGEISKDVRMVYSLQDHPSFPLEAVALDTLFRDAM